MMRKHYFDLIILAKTHNWQLYDTGIDQMIDLDNPAANGYKNFKEYLDFVLTQKN